MPAAFLSLGRKRRTKPEAARRPGVHQPRISDQFQGNVSELSIETLMAWLDRLGKRVVVTVEDKEVGLFG
jgi:predicted XRE-type DNA-binding protein